MSWWMVITGGLVGGTTTSAITYGYLRYSRRKIRKKYEKAWKEHDFKGIVL